MESEYFYTVSVLIFSHMYTTYPFSCKIMWSINNHVSGTKWTHCTVLSKNHSKQIILVYYSSYMFWLHRKCNFYLMWIWFVINFEFLGMYWLFPVHYSYHWFTEVICGCNKQVLFVFCDGYWMSKSTVWVGYIKPDICEHKLTYNFQQATHKKIPGMWISCHTMNANFYYQWYFSVINTGLTTNTAHSLKNYRKRYQTGMLLQIHYLYIFCRQCYVHKLTGVMCADGHCTWQAYSCIDIQTSYAHCQNL
jgi:hypothetical protein